MTQPVETTAQGNATGETPVETPTTVSATPTPKTYSEAEVKAAAEQARREVQAAKDRETAKLHRDYQAQLRATKQAATQTLAQQGVENPQEWERSLDVWSKAQMYDQYTAEQQQLAEWNGYVSQAATQAGLDPSDARLQGATDAVDLAAKIAKAAKEDARKELEAEKLKLKAEEQAAMAAQVASGQLHVLSGAPASGGPSTSTADKYKQEMLAARGKGREAILAIKEKYRKAGVDVDSIPLTTG